MKNTFLALVAVVLTTTLTQAQTAPADPSGAAAAGTLTKDERDRAVRYLKETEREFTTVVDGLSEAQWNFKPAPDRWSIAETAEHMAIAEEMVWKLVSEKMVKSPPAPERKAEVQGKDTVILKDIPDRSKKVQAPEQLQPTGKKWDSPAAIVQHFQRTRAQEIAYLTETQEDLRSHFEDHPFLKTLDGYQWLLLNGAHGKRHTAQIIEVKSHPAFPKK